ncbi:FGGY family carbohydrate kinase [Plantactinospora mayteni]|uniref:Carbohydrate kinase n=1 Tax=Plantactinospora mayteni TaxID=566021 RepID=A0ABQ4F1A2_9ACTN|nr:FGGY family carbohydrate kinase [Plantactinospora mayteni]GIH00647.1 carbohydrate kinase [Plantactinospora mayteni]
MNGGPRQPDATAPGRPDEPPGRAGAPFLSVGIDLGTTNTKAALVAVDESGVRVRALASAPTPEPDAVKPVLLALLRQVLRGAPAPDAVGIASMAETGVPLGRSGEPLGPWLRWNSHPAGAEADELSRRLGRDHLVAATGVRPTGKVPLATWAWLRANRPDQWTEMAAWAGAADLVCHLLTGRLCTDHTLAGRTMAYRLPDPGRPVPDGFDADLLAEVGLRPEQLPTVVPPDGAAAPLRDPDFVACGLRAGTPVVVAGHDHPVGAYAGGVREPGDVADSLGTAEAVLSVVAGAPDPIEVARAGMSSVVPVSGRHRAILAGSSSAGATVGWWLAHESAGVTAAELFGRVLESGDRPSDVIVLPYLRGRQAPAPDPAARLRILGRRPAHTPADLARAMLEGLCLQTRWMLREQARLAGRTGPGTVTLLGGAVAGNPAWVRIKAHVLTDALRVVPADEPVAAGAALVAAVRAHRVGPVVPALDWRPGPAVAGAGVDYDQPFARFVAAATGTGASTAEATDQEERSRDRNG